MNLVEYPSSDESDAESALAPKPAAGTKRPAPEPLVDASNPHKIRVNLGPAHTDADQKGVPEGPQTKRPRTGGGGLFSGLNSFLPAPKHTAGQPAATAGRAAANGEAEKPRTRAPFRLKTSSEAAFERGDGTVETNAAAEAALQKALNKRKKTASASPAPTPAAMPFPNVKPVAKKPLFRPVGMSEEVPRRKKKKPNAGTTVTAAFEKSKETQPSSTEAPKGPPGLTKPKVSLFSLSHDDRSTVQSNAKGDYQPMLLDEPDDENDEVLPDVIENDAFYQEVIPINQGASHTGAAPGTQSIEALAATLSESERRQLFGRKGAGDLSSLGDIKIKNFNTDAEYTANEEQRAKGEQQEIRAPAAIKPGKHSLRQLVNVAVTQKDALEESYARGAANKREAGSRYGWR